jgi:hypothetical protein
MLETALALNDPNTFKSMPLDEFPYSTVSDAALLSPRSIVEAPNSSWRV